MTKKSRSQMFICCCSISLLCFLSFLLVHFYFLVQLFLLVPFPCSLFPFLSLRFFTSRFIPSSYTLCFRYLVPLLFPPFPLFLTFSLYFFPFSCVLNLSSPCFLHHFFSSSCSLSYLLSCPRFQLCFLSSCYFPNFSHSSPRFLCFFLYFLVCSPCLLSLLPLLPVI